MQPYYAKDVKNYRLRRIYTAKSYCFKRKILESCLEEAKKKNVKVPGVSLFCRYGHFYYCFLRFLLNSQWFLILASFRKPMKSMLCNCFHIYCQPSSTELED